MTTPNRRNSDFQIAYMLAGKCHTPDAAYAMLLNLKEERELAIYEAEKVINIFEGRTDIEAKVFHRNLTAAHRELETINKCIDRVQPLRKYSHLTDAEAHEACQRDEWRLEFITRAENCLLSQGYIPTDQLSAMRMHPDFVSDIYPAIENATLMIKSDKTVDLIQKSNDRLLRLE